jgi:hypothetical protein
MFYLYEMVFIFNFVSFFNILCDLPIHFFKFLFLFLKFKKKIFLICFSIYLGNFLCYFFLFFQPLQNDIVLKHLRNKTTSF